jgi:hypothetical protein
MRNIAAADSSFRIPLSPQRLRQQTRRELRDACLGGGDKTLQRIQKGAEPALSQAKQRWRAIRCFLHPL